MALHAIALTLALAALLAAGSSFPTTDIQAPGEDSTLGPLEVCQDLLEAAKSKDIPRIMGHVSAYGRSRIGPKEELLIKAAHHLIIALRCVRVDSKDEARAAIWVYAPDKMSQVMPFVKEAGFWRLDAQAAGDKLKAAASR
jgi:hypothetical protein